MRYALLGDIHSNIEALQAVLADAKGQGIDRYVSLGDIIGYNASPRECLEIVRAGNFLVVRGNHDHYCANLKQDLSDFHAGAAAAVLWTREQLAADDLEYLRTLPMVLSIDDFIIVHATLDNPELWNYTFEAADTEAHFASQSTKLCFNGHTHVPLYFDRRAQILCSSYNKLDLHEFRKYLVNVGSVGQPRDGDPRAAYAIYDQEKHNVELRRIAYDYTLTQDKIKQAGLPERLATRLAIGR